nr:hypothetical protein [Psychrobacter sp. PraFG1]UNK06450.1 hypothetical protein MN210_08125 [Psychrobacter sp. PraFG1]
MNFRKRLASFLIDDRQARMSEQMPTIDDVDRSYEATNPFELGTFHHKAKQPRTRRQIYTMWEIMQADPQVSEALSLHVTAALGGHESTGDMIFITPSDHIREGGRRAKELRKRLSVKLNISHLSLTVMYSRWHARLLLMVIAMLVSIQTSAKACLI